MHSYHIEKHLLVSIPLPSQQQRQTGYKSTVKTITSRISKQEHQQITLAAKECGMSISSYCRYCIVNISNKIIENKD